MKNSIRMLSTALLVMGLHSAWAGDAKPADKPADKPAMRYKEHGVMPGGTKNMNMDNEHMQQMHEQMNEMHETHQHGRETCDMKSDGKCAEHGVRAMGAPAEEKSKTSKAK